MLSVYSWTLCRCSYIPCWIRILQKCWQFKTEVSRKNLSEQRREPTTNSTHIMVSIIIMVHIKSFNTLNQKTSFFSSTYLLISNNSNWIGALGTKSLWGWKGWNVHQFKGTQREALVYRGHILYFLELGTKDKLDLCF